MLFRSGVANITRPGEDSQPISFQFRYLNAEELQAFMSRADNRPAHEWLAEVIESWDGVCEPGAEPGQFGPEVPYSIEALETLFSEFPNAFRDVLDAYLRARLEGLQKNSSRRS